MVRVAAALRTRFHHLLRVPRPRSAAPQPAAEVRLAAAAGALLHLRRGQRLRDHVRRLFL